MKTLFRLVLVLVSGVSALYFVFWVGGAILMELLHLPLWLSQVVALVAAVAAGRYVWLHTASIHAGLTSSIVLGAIILGGVGFAGGFFGPIIFMPGANQGPLLGIFITGPLGFIFGAVGGAVYWFTRGRYRVRTHLQRHRHLANTQMQATRWFLVARGSFGTLGVQTTNALRSRGLLLLSGGPSAAARVRSFRSRLQERRIDFDH